MSNSVGTKAAKKQSPLSQMHATSAYDRYLEQSLLALESTCMRILETRFASARQDVERIYWQQRFKNIATPISLALMEHKGPRRFHYHYRHRKDDQAVLHPVMEPAPIDTLAQVCAQALSQSRTQLIGIEDDMIVEYRNMLEDALGDFLLRYREYKEKA